MLFFGKRKITQVADAIAPLQQIVNDLQGVADHQQERVENTEMMIQRLTVTKNTCQKEANMADNQVSKMKKVFGIDPE